MRKTDMVIFFFLSPRWINNCSVVLCKRSFRESQERPFVDGLLKKLFPGEQHDGGMHHEGVDRNWLRSLCCPLCPAQHQPASGDKCFHRTIDISAPFSWKSVNLKCAFCIPPLASLASKGETALPHFLGLVATCGKFGLKHRQALSDATEGTDTSESLVSA